MNEAGQPVQSFVKDLIHLGDFVKPSTNQKVTVTLAQLDHWAATANTMIAAGVKIPVPLDHSGKADANRGYARDFFVSGGSLYSTIDLVGQDGIDLAGRTEVSISIVPEIKDGNGKTYSDAIEHVALTSYPVIPSQGGFVKLSHNGQATEVPVYRLNTKGSSMNEIALALGIKTDGLTDEQIKEQCKAKATAMGSELAKMVEDTKTVKCALETMKAELARTGKTPEPPAPMVLKLARKNRELSIKALVDGANITKDVGDGLAGIFIGTDGIALSNTIDMPNDERFESIVEVLAKLPKIRTTGTQTGTQFSRPDPTDDPNDNKPATNPELQKKRLARLAPKTA